MSNAVQPMASAVNLTAPATTFMNKVRAGNRPTLMKIGAVVAILIAIILFMRRGSKKKKEEYSMKEARLAAKRAMKKFRTRG